MSFVQLVMMLCFLTTIPTSSWTNEALVNETSTCSEEQVDSCPIGLFCMSGKCECGQYQYPQDITICDKHSLSILNYVCATFDEEKKVVQIGSCLYNSGTEKDERMQHRSLYTSFHLNASDLNNATCGNFERNGTLCGKCRTGYYPRAYSFDLTCIECSNIGWNWAKYIMVAYLPLTIFYFIILFFKINVTSSFLLAIVSFCQGFASPLLARMILMYHLELPVNVLLKLMFSVYGIWNLDFFRPFYSDICLGIGILPTLALEYVIALYPFLLMIITYLLIVLYDKNYKVIRFLWRPFQAVFSLFKDNWNIKTSVIDAFATFFLLSNMKLLCVSFDLLIPTSVYELHRDHVSFTLRLYYAADIHYFDSQHCPYAILALIMLSVFVLIPVTILALYPFAFFQRFLNRFPFRWYILHTFMDAFQGCYKNGTEPGTRDCRWFSSTYYICRLFLFILYAFNLNMVNILLAVLILMLYSFLATTVEPFKASLIYHNRIFTVFIQLSALFGILLLGVSLSAGFMHKFFHLFSCLSVIIALAPFLCTVVIVARLIFKSKQGFKLFHRVKAWRNGYKRLQEPLAQEGLLSHRIESTEVSIEQNTSQFPTVKDATLPK